MRVEFLIPPSRGALYDSFCAVAKGVLPGGTIIETCGSFADLRWAVGAALGSPEDFATAMQVDPHFTVVRYPRWLAFGRVGGELRYYAGPIPPFSNVWYRAGGPEAAEVIEAEPEVSELGRLVSGAVKDAVLLARLYLEGQNLIDINVARQTYGQISAAH